MRCDSRTFGLLLTGETGERSAQMLAPRVRTRTYNQWTNSPEAIRGVPERETPGHDLPNSESACGRSLGGILEGLAFPAKPCRSRLKQGFQPRLFEPIAFRVIAFEPVSFWSVTAAWCRTQHCHKSVAMLDEAIPATSTLCRFSREILHGTIGTWSNPLTLCHESGRPHCAVLGPKRLPGRSGDRDNDPVASFEEIIERYLSPGSVTEGERSLELTGPYEYDVREETPG